VARD